MVLQKGDQKMKKIFPINSLSNKETRNQLKSDLDKRIELLQKELNLVIPDRNVLMLLSLFEEAKDLVEKQNEKAVEFLNVLYLTGSWELNHRIEGSFS